MCAHTTHDEHKIHAEYKRDVGVIFSTLNNRQDYFFILGVYGEIFQLRDPDQYVLLPIVYEWEDNDYYDLHFC